MTDAACKMRREMGGVPVMSIGRRVMPTRAGRLANGADDTPWDHGCNLTKWA